ncbi:subtilisin-like protease [Niveomyces insectorum RCEF 264]|uniref:Subtilisin-like protease n=1 Tax=Niveomyces insectorum RCEF 264 TaxID=1081102 RepID=A0A167Y7A6_9HYPO|nr:subtilisin-like protease [Niveomyces insectorum RCEF 264]
MAPIPHRLLPLLALLATAALALPLTEPAAAPVRRPPSFIANANTTAAADLIPNAYIVVYKSSASEAAVNAHQARVMAQIAQHNSNINNKNKNTNNMPPAGQVSASSVDTAANRSAAQRATTIQTFQVGSWRAMALRHVADDSEEENDGDGGGSSIMRAIASDHEVAYVEQDAIVRKQALASEMNAPSGLTRISHADYDEPGGYVYDVSAGYGIVAYIVDTGILLTHMDFQGRAVFGASFVDDDPNPFTDQDGHGSHVAGIVGGRTYGVAKNVQLVSVKVLSPTGQGAISAVIAGLNWVATNVTGEGLNGRAVVNLSFGGAQSRAVNDATAQLAEVGIVPCVAAGNGGEDATSWSPASAPGAIVVGAINQLNDVRSSFSNYGSVLSVYAPGELVLSVGIATNYATSVQSGTSMAAPHVTGLAAYLMALENITEPALVRERILQLAAATGATVLQNAANTTSLIANNGIQ